ncbi:hypothetical protein RJ640_018255 [Escallonia rubra]|uniref:Uncharacterized protein n=1 Tax=Escallonia rubra TaxID=112253 RepID=A0AA88UAP5_9ASTE|nr:hypothetical protein RJ640_018255 [Escallonia rubra]
MYDDAKNPAMAVSVFGSGDAGLVSVPNDLFNSSIDDGILANSFKTDVTTIIKLKIGLGSRPELEWPYETLKVTGLYTSIAVLPLTRPRPERDLAVPQLALPTERVVRVTRRLDPARVDLGNVVDQGVVVGLDLLGRLSGHPIRDPVPPARYLLGERHQRPLEQLVLVPGPRRLRRRRSRSRRVAAHDTPPIVVVAELLKNHGHGVFVG